MSRRHKKRPPCLTRGGKPKAKYSEFGAMHALDKIKQQGDPNHHEKRAYYCRGCHAWHLTSQDDE